MRGLRALPVVSGVFLAVGVLAVVGAVGLGLAERGSGRDRTADGVIVGFEPGGRVPLPRIEFTPAGAPLPVRFVSPSGSSLFHLGDHLRIAYAADRPGDGRIDGWSGRWLLPGLAGGLGLVFLAVAGTGFAVWRILSSRRAPA